MTELATNHSSELDSYEQIYSACLDRLRQTRPTIEEVASGYRYWLEVSITQVHSTAPTDPQWASAQSAAHNHYLYKIDLPDLVAQIQSKVAAITGNYDWTWTLVLDL